MNSCQYTNCLEYPNTYCNCSRYVGCYSCHGAQCCCFAQKNRLEVLNPPPINQETLKERVLREKRESETKKMKVPFKVKPPRPPKPKKRKFSETPKSTIKLGDQQPSGKKTQHERVSLRDEKTMRSSLSEKSRTSKDLTLSSEKQRNLNAIPFQKLEIPTLQEKPWNAIQVLSPETPQTTIEIPSLPVQPPPTNEVPSLAIEFSQTPFVPRATVEIQPSPIITRSTTPRSTIEIPQLSITSQTSMKTPLLLEKSFGESLLKQSEAPKAPQSCSFIENECNKLQQNIREMCADYKKNINEFLDRNQEYNPCSIRPCIWPASPVHRDCVPMKCCTQNQSLYENLYSGMTKQSKGICPQTYQFTQPLHQQFPLPLNNQFTQSPTTQFAPVPINGVEQSAINSSKEVPTTRLTQLSSLPTTEFLQPPSNQITQSSNYQFTQFPQAFPQQFKQPPNQICGSFINNCNQTCRCSRLFPPYLYHSICRCPLRNVPNHIVPTMQNSTVQASKKIYNECSLCNGSKVQQICQCQQPHPLFPHVPRFGNYYDMGCYNACNYAIWCAWQRYFTQSRSFPAIMLCPYPVDINTISMQ